jgi:hypothetical protein
MPARSTPYALAAVTCSVAGLPIRGGEEGGEFITIAQPEDDVGYKSSGDGEGAFFTKKNRRVDITIKVIQTGEANGLLTAIHAASLAGDAPAPFPFFFEDRAGTSKIVSDAAMFTKLADEVYAEEPGYNTWALIVHDPIRIVGGH